MRHGRGGRFGGTYRRQQGLADGICRSSAWLLPGRPAPGRASVSKRDRSPRCSRERCPPLREGDQQLQRVERLGSRDEKAVFVSPHQPRWLLRGDRPGLRLAGRGRGVQRVCPAATGRGGHAGIRVATYEMMAGYWPTPAAEQDDE